MALQSAVDTIPLPVTRGGTGVATLLNHGVVVGATTSPVTSLAVGASGTILAGSTGADPAFTATPTGLTSVTATSFITSSATVGTTFTNNSMTPTGSDANIDLQVNGKGSGGVIHSRGLVGGDVTVESTNTDNTNGASRGGFEAAVGGATAGDPYVNFLVSGAGSFTMGIDNSDSDNFKISTGTALGTTDDVRLTSAGALSVLRGDLDVTRSQTGTVTGTVSNTSVGAGTDNSLVQVTSGGAAGGDAYLGFTVTGAGSWVAGIDNSDTDAFVISNGTAIGTTNVIKATAATSAISIPSGDFDVTRSATGNVLATVSNTSVGAGTDNAVAQITSGGAAGGDAQLNFTVTGASSHYVGIDNSDSDALAIGLGTAVGTTTNLKIATAGATSVLRGDFDVTRSQTGNVISTVSNTSVGAGTDNAVAQITSGGAAGGDAQLNLTITGADSHYIGIDNSDSDALEIGLGTAVGTTANVKIGTAGAVSILRGNLDVTRSQTGTVLSTISNTLAGAGTDNSQLQITSGGAAGGDPYIGMTVTGAESWTIGIDNSNSDVLAISSGTVLGTNDLMRFVPGSFQSSFISGDVDITRNLNGSPVSLTVSNTFNTAGSDGALTLNVGDPSAGDPRISYTITGGGSTWSHGVDNSASDAFKLSQNAAIGTSDVMVASTAGEITYPLQPAFLAYLAGTAANKTGNGASYTIGTDALTEVFDRGADFNTNGTFTAPVTGIYDLRAQVTITGATVATTFTINIVTTARTYTYVFTRAAAATDQAVSISALADMTATNTATVTIVASGEAGDTDDILGGASAVTYFCGKLVA